MAANQSYNSDRLMRSHRRNDHENPEATKEQRRKRLLLVTIIAAAVLVAVLLCWCFLGSKGEVELSASSLPCYANQGVIPFGNDVVYYDGTSLHCLSGTGNIRWSFPIGSSVYYVAGPSYLAAWSGSRLYLIDQQGNASYTDDLEEEIQFVRVGQMYAAVVMGDDTEPTVSIKNLKGVQVDSETDAFSGLMVLDVGFFGEQGEYMWTLSLDVFGTAANTIMNTFQVGKMNTGEVSLGEKLTYKVIYENARLRVFTTQQMYCYDYKCVQDTSATKLIYGWKLLDAEIPSRGNVRLLMAPTSQTGGSQTISELRTLEGDEDRRYSLPADCVGACIHNGNIYAFSADKLYRAELNHQKFTSYEMPLKGAASVTAYYGLTGEGRALLATGDSMISLRLPQ